MPVPRFSKRWVMPDTEVALSECSARSEDFLRQHHQEWLDYVSHNTRFNAPSMTFPEYMADEYGRWDDEESGSMDSQEIQARLAEDPSVPDGVHLQEMVVDASPEDEMPMSDDDSQRHNSQRTMLLGELNSSDIESPGVEIQTDGELHSSDIASPGVEIQTDGELHSSGIGSAGDEIQKDGQVQGSGSGSPTVDAKDAGEVQGGSLGSMIQSPVSPESD